jgi:hypothetical protein
MCDSISAQLRQLVAQRVSEVRWTVLRAPCGEVDGFGAPVDHNDLRSDASVECVLILPPRRDDGQVRECCGLDLIYVCSHVATSVGGGTTWGAAHHQPYHLYGHVPLPVRVGARGGTVRELQGHSGVRKGLSGVASR